MTEVKGKLIFDKRFFKENEELLDKYFGLTNARKNKKHSENTAVPDSPLDDAIKRAKKVRGLAAASNTDSQKSEKTH